MALPSTDTSKISVGTDLITFAFDGPSQVDEKTPVYIDAEEPSRSLSKSQTRMLVRRLVAGFQAVGLRRGECVLVVLANDILYSPLLFGVIGAGGVHHGVNPRSTALELDHVLTLAEPKLIVTSPDAFTTVHEAAAAQGYSTRQIFLVDLGAEPSSLRSDCPPTPPSDDHLLGLDLDLGMPVNLCDLLNYGEADWIRFDNEKTAKSTPAVMYSTSGTGGLPKAAVLSHYALVAQHLSIAPRDQQYKTSRLICLPSFHILAALYLHIFPVRRGEPVVIMRRFQTERFVDHITGFGVTDTYMAPPMVNALLNSTEPLGKLLRTLRLLLVGGAPTGPDKLQQLKSHLHPSATLSQIWGTTETGAVTLHQFPAQDGCDGSIGFPLPGYEMRLQDDAGNVILDDNQSGEAQVRTAGMMIGYKNQVPQPVGEWYSTGDVMTRANGKYFVVGRLKELIKVNGFSVAPAELEGVLLSHPAISDAAVIGVIHPTRVTEVPRAYVVRRTDLWGCHSPVTSDDVSQFVRQRLASFKALEGGVVFVDNIPRTPSGKIQRFRLSKMDEYRSTVTELLVKMNAPPAADAVSGALQEDAPVQQASQVNTACPMARASKLPSMALSMPRKVSERHSTGPSRPQRNVLGTNRVRKYATAGVSKHRKVSLSKHQDERARGDSMSTSRQPEVVPRSLKNRCRDSAWPQ